jgi:hypothetical protein
MKVKHAKTLSGWKLITISISGGGDSSSRG